MTPEELAALFKRRGDFDSTRKSLLSDFQNSSVGQQFTTQLGDILQTCIDEDPSLLQREKSDFHQAMVERITKSSEYKKVQQFVDSLLQPTQYMSKIENTLMTIVKEHAPPPAEKDTAQDDDKAKGHRNSKGHSPTSSKQSKGSPTEDGSKELNSNSAFASSSGSTAKATTSSTKAPSTKKEDGGESHKSNGGFEKRTKDNTSGTAKVKKELNLGLPPRPQPRIKERNQGHITSMVPLVKKESSSSDLQPSTESPAERPRKHSNHPRKRNRRQQSVDSNSSLSSPPSSSEVDSDGDGKEKEGSRAKKLAKKAARDYRADSASKASTGPEADVSKAKDLPVSDTAEPMEGVEASAGAVPAGDDQDATNLDDHSHPSQSDTAKPDDATKDDAMDVDTADTAVTDATEGKKEASRGNATEIEHANVVQEGTTSMQGKEANKDSAPEATLSDKPPITPMAPVSTTTRSGTSSSSSASSNPPSVNDSPAVVGAGANRRRESDAVDRRASPGHHGSSHSKRTGHLPLPLPPRPSLSLPPKPTAPLSSSRKASHNRNPSSVTSSTGPSGIKSTSSTTSASASVPPLASSSSGTRQPSVSGSSGSTGGSGGSTRDKAPSDRADTRSSGQGHVHHPLPPPPHLHHPLPPTPKSGYSGSRSHSVSGASKSTTPSSSASSSKPLISTSQTLIGAGPSSDNSAPTTSTPQSATSLTSPSSAGARHSPRTEDQEAGGSGRGSSEAPSTTPASKGDHKLKSPESNSSSGSISSTGSLSTTGSTTNLTAMSLPDTGSQEAASILEPAKDHAVPALDAASALKPVESSATAMVQESASKSGGTVLDSDTAVASQSEAIEHPPTVPPPPPTSSPPPSASSPPPPPPPPPPEPPVASPTPPPPPSTPTPTATPPSRPSSSKQERALPGGSPSSSSSRPKSHGRTPIPLPSKPHKPIPLPQRPSAPASGGGLGSLKKKYKG